MSGGGKAPWAPFQIKLEAPERKGPSSASGLEQCRALGTAQVCVCWKLLPEVSEVRGQGPAGWLPLLSTVLAGTGSTFRSRLLGWVIYSGSSGSACQHLLSHREAHFRTRGPSGGVPLCTDTASPDAPGCPLCHAGLWATGPAGLRLPLSPRPRGAVQTMSSLLWRTHSRAWRG